MGSISNWKWKSLDDIVDSVTIGLVKNSREQDPGFDYTYIKMNNIGNNNSFNLFKSSAVNASEEEILKYGLRDNDFLFNTRNSVELVGKSCLYRSWSDAPVLYNNNIARIRFKDEISPAYAAYAFCSPFLKDQLESMKQGTTNVAAIYYKSLKNLKIGYPPIPEQQRIVAILDQAFADIEKARANAEKNLKNARELFNSYLQQVFSQRGEGWVEKSLGDAVLVERGSSPRPIKEFQTDSEDGVNWIKIGDAKAGQKYITSTKEKITKKGAEKSRFVDVGDFILSNSMSFGRPYIMSIQGYIHDGWFVLRLPDEIDSEYFYYLLSSPYLVNQFQDLAAGAIVKNISGDLVKKAIVPIPSSQTQTEMVEEFKTWSQKIDYLEGIYKTKLNSLDELKKSLLQKAFSGELTKSKGIAA